MSVSPLQVLTLGADAAYLSRRDPPTAPDGQYDWQVSQQDGSAKDGHSAVTNFIGDVQSLKTKEVYVPDPKTVSGFVGLAVNGDTVDDRKGAFEGGLAIMSRLPQGSATQTQMSNAAIAMLYNAIPHPPATFVGPEYNFRHADGGYNNIQQPDMGRAGTRYSRSVQPERVMPTHTLPDPGLIFDTLLRRRGVSIARFQKKSFFY
jgi:linoleate 10R-lipoxygenase